jgi:hypothetical protein
MLIVVDNPADSGSDTLRHALENAQPYDTIVFDSTIFQPSDPQRINIESELPIIEQGHLTIDASDAGVILDGSLLPADSWISGLEVASEGNVVLGMQVVNFTGVGIAISEGGHQNVIGGDPSIGQGPSGQGNLTGGNDIGIGMWNFASNNVVTGNLIGTDSSGTEPRGNRSAGVWLTDGASQNVIGPENIIAFNGDSGVLVADAISVGNTITRNSIHDNVETAIFLSDGDTAEPGAPLFLDFDIEAGTMAGWACAGCTVEIFSDVDNEAGVYEGQTVADSSGNFALDKGGSFSGPYLTATATDSDGKSSQLSIPTSGPSRSSIWQDQNDLARTRLVTKPSDELEDNRIGGVWSNFWVMDIQQAIDTHIVPMGLKVVKISISQPEPSTFRPGSDVGIDWSKPELSIPSVFDEQVTDLVSHGVTIYYMLNFWDKANNPDGWQVRSRFRTEEDISRYLEYVRFVVSHFKGRVKYYELWNEPDVRAPLHYIEPADFISLAKRTIPVIKEIDPEALVVIPSTSGTAHREARQYLFRILNSDLMPMADGISWHPFFDDAPDSSQFPQYYADYPSLLFEIMSTARDNGFQGEFVVGEITFSGPGCDGCMDDSPSFSDIVSAKYTARGAILHLGNDVVAGLGGLSTERPVHTAVVRNMANVFAGASAETFTVDTQTTAENVKVFTFTRTDGSKLVAIGTDGVAVENDPGVVSSLRIPGFAGSNASGIDILNNYEQELITSSEDRDLIVEGVFIRDYPFIIRLSAPGSS